MLFGLTIFFHSLNGLNNAFRVFMLCFSLQAALAAEWDCSATSGVFTQSGDCVVSSQVEVERIPVGQVPREVDVQQVPM